MRWPLPNWLRGVAGRDDPSLGRADGARAAPGPDPGPIPGPDRDAGRVAWRELPPVQRAVGAAPLTAPSAEFARGLAGRRVPDLMLAPLGHDVTADGPAGLVSGIAMPLVQRAAVSADPGSFAAVPPVARGRARPTAQRLLTTSATLPRSGAVTDPAGIAATDLPNDGPFSAAVAAQAAAAEHGAPADRAATLPDLALRALPVARLATGAPAIAATRVADASAPAPVVALAPSVGAPASAGESLAPAGTSGSPGAMVPDATVTVSRATGAAPATTPATPPDASAVARPALDAGGDSGHPIPTRRTLGESRRLGLGAPLTERPQPAGRETGRSDLPVARLHRSTDPASTTSARPPIAPVMRAVAAESPPLPRLVVARRSPTVQHADAVPEASPPAAGPVDATPPATPASSVGEPDQPAGEQAGQIMAELPTDVARPLVGDVPIGVSRLARADAAVTDVAVPTDTEEAREPGGPPLHLAAASRALPAMPGRATSTAPGAPTADVRGTPATGDPGGPHAFAALQRSLPAAVGGVPPSAQGVAIAGRPVSPTAPLVAARSFRAGSPIGPVSVGSGSAFEPAPVVARIAIPWPDAAVGVDAPGAAQLGAAARPVAPSAPAPASQRDERPVVARSALATGRGSSPAPGSALPLGRPSVRGTEPVATGPDEAASGRSGGVVSWAVGTGFTTVASTPGPFVQRAVAIDDMTVTPGGESAGTAGPGASAGAGQPGAGGAGTDYEELAEQVYDKIRARLTTELLLDRERAGLLVDG